MKIKIILLLCCVWMMNAVALEGKAENGLVLEQALLRVLENHPQFRVADYQTRAMTARIRQALLAPADTISINLQDFAGSGETRDVRGIEATLSLSRTLELGNKAALRGRVVEREKSLLRNRNDIERLDLLAETARRFVNVAADQERLRIAEDAIELIRVTEKTVEARIRAGRTPTAERQRVAIDLANYELDLDHTRHEMESSRLRLAVMWGDKQAEFGSVTADIYELGELPGFEELSGLLERNPDLLRYISTEDVARARVRLAQSKRKPDLDLSAGLRYLGGGDDVALMFSASLPLGSAGRAQSAIEEAEVLSRIEPLNLEQKRLELHATLFEIYQELKHAMDAVETLRERIIPAAEKMLDDYERGYRAGRYSLLELVQIQQLLRNARSRSVEAASDYHGYRIEIDRLTGAQFN